MCILNGDTDPWRNFLNRSRIQNGSPRTRVTVIIWHIGSVHGQPLPVTELVVENGIVFAMIYFALQSEGSSQFPRVGRPVDGICRELHDDTRRSGRSL
jgi:hypothetical protein